MNTKMKKHLQSGLCIVMALLLAFTVYTPYHADAAAMTVANRGTLNVEETGTYEIQKQLTNDGSWSHSDCTTNNYGIYIKNTSSSTKNVSFNMKVTGDFKNNYTIPETFFLNGKFQDDGSFNASETFKLKPGASTELLGIKLKSIFTGSYKILITVKVSSDYDNSRDKDHPVKISPEKLIKGNGDSVAPYAHYYSFTLSEDSAVRFSSENLSSIELGKDGNINKDASGGKVLYLEKGKYLVRAGIPSKDNEVYSFTLHREKYNYGKVKIKWEGDSNRIAVGKSKKFTLTYTPGKNFGKNNGSAIMTVNDKKVKGNTCKGSVNSGKPGYHYIEADINGATWKTFKYKYISVPQSPAKPANEHAVTGSYNTLKIKAPFNSKTGSYISLQRYKNGKWVTLGTRNVKDKKKPFKVTKLKSNTVYKFRFTTRTGKTKQNPAIYGKAGKSFSIRTAPKSKPSVTVKVENVKVKSYKGYWTKGHWNTLHTVYYPSEWVKPHKTTYYTLKVTLKKSVKGCKTVQIKNTSYLPDYNKVKGYKGSSKTYKLSCSTAGNAKGKKIKVYVRTQTNYPGIVSPAATKTVTIK